MDFTTATFLIFVSVAFGVYWLLPQRRQQNVFLLAAGYAFYSWWDPRYCALLAISTIVDYICGLGCARGPRRRNYLIVSLITNLGLLGVFKYFNFFQESLLHAFGTLGVSVEPMTVRLVLPVGISFYTFQTMSYTIDVYRGKIEPHRSFIDYAAYVCFFPQLVAGPIERASSLLTQFSLPRQFCPLAARDGLRQILWGFFKKMVIADQAAIVANEIYAAPASFDARLLWLGTLAFSFQIYCDFSAYSDIALGTARLFGFKLSRNFALPYYAQDFGEFWRRWHITLSIWFRDYVYIPLGGRQRGRIRQLLAILVVFTLSGLWHGAGWNFIIWGLLHGILVVVSSWVRPHSLNAADVPLGNTVSVGAVARALIVFTLTTVCWVFFRADSVGQAGQILTGLFSFHGDQAAALQSKGALGILSRVLPIFLIVEFVTRRCEHPLQAIVGLPKPLRWATYATLIWGTGYYMARQPSEFVYFQF